MKNRMLGLFRSSVKYSVPGAKLSCLQLNQLKENQFPSCKIPNKGNWFRAGSSAFITLFFLIISVQSNAQITDTTIFPLNDYLYTTGTNPYPLVNEDKVKAIDISKFVNVMDYGAKGDGKTYDDYAIKKAFAAAQYGVIFPAGRTFLVSKISKVTLTHDLTVYAYGATIKMAANCRYSFLLLQYQSGSYNNNLIWLGGTFDGNKNQQSWPGSPTGNNSFAEEHGRFVGASFAKFALFKDVKLINLVMDGISLEGNAIAAIANCKASDGAKIDFAATGDQASYFKCTRTSSKAFYLINDTCLDGSIGIHYSTPTSEQSLQKNTLTVMNNCYLYNQYSGALHFEDCKKVFLYKCRIEGDTKEAYKHALHFSNQTEVAAIKNSQFRNMCVNFNEAKSLKLGLIDSCTFTTETPNLRSFIAGNPHLSTHNTFSGSCASQQADVKNVKSCTFSNFKSLAVYRGYATDSSTFINGTTPVSMSKGGFVVNCTFQQVTNKSTGNIPPTDTWKKVFSSYINVYSDANTYLGRIDCGFTTTQNVTQTATATVATTSAATAAITSSNVSNGIQNSVIKLYPNPAVDEVHVTLNDKVSGKTALNIYDQQGRLVQAKTVYKNTLTTVESINVHNLITGTYVLQIVNDFYKSSFKFVIAK